MRRRLIRAAAMIAAWLPALVLWLAFAMAGGQVSLTAAFVPSVLTIGIAAVIGLAIWEVCVRVQLPEKFRAGFFAIHLLAAIVYSVVWVVATTAIEPLITHQQMWGILKTPRALTWGLTGIWLYAIVAGISYAIIAQQRARENERRALRAEAGLSAARLDALQHRLHPHFLFNALHTVAALVRQDSQQAENAIEKLGDMLRYTLQDDVGNTVPFAEEWEFTRRYLDFEQLRHGERLTVITAIDPACMSYSAPLFALQTLVENAVHHSIATRPEGGRIEITAQPVDKLLLVQVRDDGGNGKSSQDGLQFGLSALRERLHAVYGDKAKLCVASDSSGFQVSFMIPGTFVEDFDDE